MGRERIGLSATAKDAVVVLGHQIRMARQERALTVAELAARAGVSERTISQIERGSNAVSIGNVFNAAVSVGLPLFGAETAPELLQLRRIGEERLALMPTRVRRPKANVDTDF